MFALANRVIDSLQAKFPPNRVVVLLTPLVFVPASGWASAWLAKHFPGISFDQTELRGFMVAGGLAAVATAYKWLDGWQKHENARRQAGTLLYQVGTIDPAKIPDHLHAVPIYGDPKEVVAVAPTAAISPVPGEPEPPVDQHESSTAPSESTGGSSPEVGSVPAHPTGDPGLEAIRAEATEALRRSQGFPPPDQEQRTP